MRHVKIAAAALLLCSILGASRAHASAATVEIGVDLPISGADASQGIPMLDGAKLAIEDANAHAPHGLQFALDALDEAVQGVHNPQQGATNVRTFIGDPAVLGILGPLASNVAAAEIPIASEAGIALVSGSATNPALTRTTKYRIAHPDAVDFFRVCATDDLQGVVGARFARARGFARIYVIDDDETYGKGLADVFAAAFTRLGGTILGRDHVTPNQQDFHALLSKVAATHPDAVYWGGVTSTGGLLLRQQMPEAGIDPARVAYLGGDGLQDPDFPVQAGAAADNTFYTAGTPNLARLPAARAFVAAYRARFGTAPIAYSANYYAATQVLIAAIERALHAPGALPSRTAVLAALRATRNYPTVIGEVSFDANGDTTNALFSVYAIEHGRETWLQQFRVARR